MVINNKNIASFVISFLIIINANNAIGEIIQEDIIVKDIFIEIYKKDEYFSELIVNYKINKINHKKIKIETTIASCDYISIINNHNIQTFNEYNLNYIEYSTLFYQSVNTDCPIALTTKILVDDKVVDQLRKFIILENINGEIIINEEYRNKIHSLEDNHE
jgi:hypothetical protein